MYTQQDLERARSQARTSALTAGGLLTLGIALLAAGLALRIKALAAAGLVVPAMAAYFVYDVWCAPRCKYVRFLKDLLGGRSHDARGVMGERAAQPRRSEEGVLVYDMPIRLEGEQSDTLFYWDAQRPLPPLDQGAAVALTAYGRYIVKICAV